MLKSLLCNAEFQIFPAFCSAYSRCFASCLYFPSRISTFDTLNGSRESRRSRKVTRRSIKKILHLYYDIKCNSIYERAFVNARSNANRMDARGKAKRREAGSPSCVPLRVQHKFPTLSAM